MLPEVDTARDYWIPTPEQIAELVLIEDLEARTVRSNELFLQWRQARLDENARRKALNEVAKTRIDLRQVDLEEIREAPRRGKSGERREVVLPHQQEDWPHRN